MGIWAGSHYPARTRLVLPRGRPYLCSKPVLVEVPPRNDCSRGHSLLPGLHSEKVTTVLVPLNVTPGNDWCHLTFPYCHTSFCPFFFLAHFFPPLLISFCTFSLSVALNLNNGDPCHIHHFPSQCSQGTFSCSWKSKQFRYTFKQPPSQINTFVLNFHTSVTDIQSA